MRRTPETPARTQHIKKNLKELKSTFEKKRDRLSSLDQPTLETFFCDLVLGYPVRLARRIMHLLRFLVRMAGNVINP